MNRYILVAALVAIAMCRFAFARPPYPALFAKEYPRNALLLPVALTEKCNVCHDAASKNKKDRNEYGKALNKHLTADDFNALKGAKPALEAKVSAALKATEEEKNAAGNKYGDILKAGKLPAP
jgi:hypothetical protein